MFSALLEAVLVLGVPWSLAPRLVTTYLLLLVLAAHLMAFDLHYALPCSVSAEDEDRTVINDGLCRIFTNSTLTSAGKRSLAKMSEAIYSSFYAYSSHL